MTGKTPADPKQALGGMMGGAASQPMAFGNQTSADVDPLVRFDQKTSGRANKAAKERSLMSGTY